MLSSLRFCLLAGSKNLKADGQEVATARDCGNIASEPSWDIKLTWMSLAACTSVLLLAVTTHLTQNVAPVPFLWVLPLGVYLLIFVLAFDSDRWTNLRWYTYLIGPTLLGMAVILLKNRIWGINPDGFDLCRRTVFVLHVLPHRAGAP